MQTSYPAEIPAKLHVTQESIQLPSRELSLGESHPVESSAKLQVTLCKAKQSSTNLKSPSRNFKSPWRVFSYLGLRYSVESLTTVGFDHPVESLAMLQATL